MGLAAIKARIGLPVLEGLVTGNNDERVTGGVDGLGFINKMLDIIVENADAGGKITGEVFQADIFLQAELGPEILVAYIIDMCSGVETIGSDLGDIRRTVAAADVDF